MPHTWRGGGCHQRTRTQCQQSSTAHHSPTMTCMATHQPTSSVVVESMRFCNHLLCSARTPEGTLRPQRCDSTLCYKGRSTTAVQLDIACRQRVTACDKCRHTTPHHTPCRADTPGGSARPDCVEGQVVARQQNNNQLCADDARKSKHRPAVSLRCIWPDLHSHAARHNSVQCSNSPDPGACSSARSLQHSRAAAKPATKQAARPGRPY